LGFKERNPEALALPWSVRSIRGHSRDNSAGAFRLEYSRETQNFAIRDKLALVVGQSHVKLAQGERQCFLYTSSRKATFLSMCSCGINLGRLCMRATCVRVTGFRPAASLRRFLACTARRSQMPTPNWSRKG